MLFYHAEISFVDSNELKLSLHVLMLEVTVAFNFIPFDSAKLLAALWLGLDLFALRCPGLELGLVRQSLQRPLNQYKSFLNPCWKP